MVVYEKLALVTVATLSLFAFPGACKCVQRAIYINGSIVGPITDDLKVIAEVTPDPNWDRQPEIVLKHGKFAGEVYFDATKSEGRLRDNCSRVPTTVDVVLLKGGREVNRVHLDVPKEFTTDERHDYRTGSPIVLYNKP